MNKPQKFKIINLKMQSNDYSNYVYTTEEAINTVWIMVSTAFIFFMQAGFALLESGSVRQKNLKNSLYKQLLDTCLSAIVWWLIGFGFAYGNPSYNNFIGNDNRYFAGNSFNYI